jgi:peroxiredoxin Q/BCP
MVGKRGESTLKKTAVSSPKIASKDSTQSSSKRTSSSLESSTGKNAPKSYGKSAITEKKIYSFNGSVAVGAKAPDFRLQDENGKSVSLKDFSGRVLVLYFYPKDNTPGCTQESCDFRDHMNRLSSAGAAVLGVSADSVESHKKFKTKYDLNFQLLSDPDHEALSAYGVWQEKSLYGRKFMGIVRSTFVIDGKGLVRSVFPKVSVKGHVEEVLAVVKSMKSEAKGGKA